MTGHQTPPIWQERSRSRRGHMVFRNRVVAGTCRSPFIIRAVTEWSLAQISRLLQEPQHRLIYLCEKRAVVPDRGDARGRGSSRGFSERNILEFALALRLRRLELPVPVVAAGGRACRGLGS